jgi:predicted nucleic acid-binding protein
VIVIDASVLTDVLLGRPQALAVLEEELVGHEQEPLHAPELIEPETLNALRGLARSGAVTQTRAADAVRMLGETRLVRYPHAPLRRSVWALRNRLSAYDATYVALAEVLGDVVLLTADAGLATVARRLLGAKRVRHAA